MKCIFLLLVTLLNLVSSTDNRDFKLGTVNGAAKLKNNGIWRSVSNSDKGLGVHLSDSVSVEKSLFINETIITKKGTKTKSFMADCGKWTVADIVSGKAYNPNRKPIRSGEPVKGPTDSVFFDVLVNGAPVEVVHFGDYPEIRVINDRKNSIYFASFWMEGDSVWRMQDVDKGISLPGKSSTVEVSRNSIIVGPPSGKASVIVIISSEEFSTEEINRFRSGNYSYRTLIKTIMICE